MGINDYLTALRRRWPTVVVAGLPGPLIGYVVAPSAASQANRPASSALGLALCLVLGGMLALARKHFDTRFRERAGTDVVSADALSDTRHLLAIAPTADWAQSHAPTKQVEARMAVYRHGRRISTAQAVSALSAISGLRDKAAFLHALVLPKSPYCAGRQISAVARLRYGVAEARRGRGSTS